MEGMEQSDWYVVYTESRAERNVMRQLKAKGIESRFPSRRHVCQWGDSTREVDVPLVCGSLFVKVPAPCLSEVLSVKGVVGYVEKKRSDFLSDGVYRYRSVLSEDLFGNIN